MNRIFTYNLFFSEFENQAIERIQKFARIANAMRFDICLGFSGGKDSQVTYDLMKRSEVEFKAYFNHAFESNSTLKFIRQYYPDVSFRRDHKFGFIENIYKNHNGFLPTVQAAYCCADYKHNSKNVDKCSVVGVRRSESRARKERTTFEAKNKTTMKNNKDLFNSYFEENCQSTGTASVIQLKPIIDWTDDNVWEYIYKYNLPINPEYKHSRRVGCIVCPKANFTSNFHGLMRYPKLIDAFIRAREKSTLEINWIITAENKDFSDNKVEYICRWLNHSFMPFTKKQEKLFFKLKQQYEKICINDQHNISFNA